MLEGIVVALLALPLLLMLPRRGLGGRREDAGGMTLLRVPVTDAQRQGVRVRRRRQE